MHPKVELKLVNLTKREREARGLEPYLSHRPQRSDWPRYKKRAEYDSLSWKEKLWIYGTLVGVCLAYVAVAKWQGWL